MGNIFSFSCCFYKISIFGKKKSKNNSKNNHSNISPLINNKNNGEIFYLTNNIITPLSTEYSRSSTC